MIAGPSTDLERLVRTFRRRCFWAAFAGAATRAAAVALLVAGCWTLVARIGLGVEGGAEHLGWAVLVAVVPYAAFTARRRVPSRGAAAAWLDARSGGTGALVTRVELGDVAEWDAVFADRTRRAPDPPGVRGRALLGPWPAALLFAVACPLVPVARPEPPPDRGVEAVLAREIERARERLEVLEEELLLEDEVRAELRERLDRLDRALANNGLDAGFEGLDALQREMERVAREATETGAEVERAVAGAATASTRGGEAASRATREALEELRRSPLGGTVDEELLQRLEALADRAAAQFDEDGRLASEAELERWLEWFEEWSAVQAELREELLASLERLAEAGLVDEAERREAEHALAELDEAVLDQLAEQLARALEDLELDEERAAELRERLAGLQPAPQMSDALSEALQGLQERLAAELDGVERPTAPDLSKLLEEIDPTLRAELFEALADAQRRQLEAAERAIELDPEAFGIDEAQLEALRRALETMQGKLAEWIAQQLAEADPPELAALASALGRAARGEGAEGGLDDEDRERLAAALEDLFEAAAGPLGEALADVPPDVRRQALERLAEEFRAAAAGTAPRDHPAADLDPESAARMAELLERIAAGPPPGTPEALSPQDVRNAIEALRAMRPELPGLGVP